VRPVKPGEGAVAIFEWNESLSVGVAEMDNQHKGLYALLSDLFQAMSQGKGNEALERVLGGLLTYTRTHFAAEERLMAAHGYPGLAAQKSAHEAFAARVAQTAASLRQGQTVMSVSVGSFMREWLTRHIQGTDKQYAAFFNAKGVF